jgi:hypothetical protein
VTTTDPGFVFLNPSTRVWHNDKDCSFAKRSRFIQRTQGDGSNILNGKPCSLCVKKPVDPPQKQPEDVTLNLTGRFRGTYTLADDPDLLSALGPAILSHLGCSFEIRWPDETDEDRERRAKDRKATRVQGPGGRRVVRRWVHSRRFSLDGNDRDYVRRLLAEAYLAGHAAAPKPVNR